MLSIQIVLSMLGIASKLSHRVVRNHGSVGADLHLDEKGKPKPFRIILIQPLTSKKLRLGRRSLLGAISKACLAPVRMNSPTFFLITSEKWHPAKKATLES
jgi:hypothetical protein